LHWPWKKAVSRSLSTAKTRRCSKPMYWEWAASADRSEITSLFVTVITKLSAQIETVDMARRGIHNEAAELLRERLAGKIEIDFDTARRLFTLICVLHIKA
jgi:hypothetical protein